MRRHFPVVLVALAAVPHSDRRGRGAPRARRDRREVRPHRRCLAPERAGHARVSGSRGSTLLGVRVVRFTVRWNQIAAKRPTVGDRSDRRRIRLGGRRRGAGRPARARDRRRAATGRHPELGQRRARVELRADCPRARFAAFATAAATHYPWVRRWLIWNEPNQVRWLRPTTPAIYTSRLLNPAYAAIHARSPEHRSRAAARRRAASTGGVSPVAWLTGMRKAHARLDAYAHNPYPLTRSASRRSAAAARTARRSRWRRSTRLVALVARNFPRARIWLTEYGYQTNPPDPLLGVSFALQARYVGQGAYAAYRTPRVDLLIHFLYRDEPILARFQSGIVTLANKAKPVVRRIRASARADARDRGERVAVGAVPRTGHGRDRAHRAQAPRPMAHRRDRAPSRRRILPLDRQAAAARSRAVARGRGCGRAAVAHIALGLRKERSEVRVQKRPVGIERATQLDECAGARVARKQLLARQVVELPQCTRASNSPSRRSTSRRYGSYSVPGVPETEITTVSRP